MAKLINYIMSIKRHIGAVSPNKKVSAGSKRWEYVDLNELIQLVDEAIDQLGLSELVFYNFVGVDGKAGVRFYDLETGETLTSVFPIESSLDGQEMGKQITYFSRYALKGFLCLPMEVDNDLTDSKHTSLPQATTTVTPKTKQTRQPYTSIADKYKKKPVQEMTKEEVKVEVDDIAF
jgi:hypothetical protein